MRFQTKGYEPWRVRTNVYGSLAEIAQATNEKDLQDLKKKVY